MALKLTSHRPGAPTTARRLAALVATMAAFAFALTACASPGAVSVSDPQLQGTWHLASASDRGLGIPLSGNSITLRIADAKHTGGDSPCSSYSATVTGGVGVVYISAQLDGGTRDDCATPQLNSLEKNYLDALTSSRYARVQEGSLILSSPRSYLVFVRATHSPGLALRGSSWRLYALPVQPGSEQADPGLNPVYLRFDGGTGLRITSPCATFVANYTIDGEHFAVSAQHVIAGNGPSCTFAERSLGAEAAVLLDGPLLVDVNSAGNGDPATLVVTNLNEDVPLVWRATE